MSLTDQSLALKTLFYLPLFLTMFSFSESLLIHYDFFLREKYTMCWFSFRDMCGIPTYVYANMFFFCAFNLKFIVQWQQLGILPQNS